MRSIPLPTKYQNLDCSHEAKSTAFALPIIFYFNRRQLRLPEPVLRKLVAFGGLYKESSIPV